MSRKKTGPRESSLIASADQHPDRHTDDRDERADDQVEPAFDDPVGPGEDGRPELEERNALPGHVLATPFDEQLGRARGDPDLHAPPVGLLDDVDELSVAEVGVGHDQLVHFTLRQHRGERREIPQHRQAGAVGRDRDGSDELVVDPAAACAERPSKAREALALADEDRAAPDARELEQIAGDDVIASAQEADADRGQDDRRRRQPVRAEPVARAESEDHRDHRDQRERGDDPAEPAAPFALGIEPRLPEDEHRDQGQEGQPFGFGVPQEAPEGPAVAVHELAYPERSVDPEHQPDEIEDDERGDARRTPHGAAQREVGIGRADVAKRLAVATLVPPARAGR